MTLGIGYTNFEKAEILATNQCLPNEQNNEHVEEDEDFQDQVFTIFFK